MGVGAEAGRRRRVGGRCGSGGEGWVGEGGGGWVGGR